MLACGNDISHNELQYMSHSTHILGGHHIYHHATNISQHHLQLGAHNICHYGKNINVYIQQIIMSFYYVK